MLLDILIVEKSWSKSLKLLFDLKIVAAEPDLDDQCRYRLVSMLLEWDRVIETRGRS